MPELPEVETIRRELKSRIVNQKIQSCTILRKDVIGYPKPKDFCTALINKEILDVTRKAKYLILELSHDSRIMFHLRLSGTIYLRDHDAQHERFTRVIITLNDYQLFFNEPRVLGRVYFLYNNENIKIPKGYYTLGYEPISPEFDFNYFMNKIKGRKARIKALLLDQSICAGVGNIYSDEALFHAGIRPLRRAYTMTVEEIFKLLVSLKDVLQRAVDKFGTSVGDYTRTDGKNGMFQDFLYVYSREHEPCRICGTEIAIKKISSRSTRYCPRCQK
jgi:formamidopyrimidine-DNA glycosylase